QTLVIQKHSLQPPIRTYRSTHNLAHMRKYTIENQRKNSHRNKSAQMRIKRFGDKLVQRIYADDIRENYIGDKYRYKQENTVFKQFFPCTRIGVRPLVKFLLLCPISFDQIFYPTEY